MSISHVYASFRGSVAFPVLLASMVFSWMTWSILLALHMMPGPSWLDTPGEWGTLNVALSIEASITTSLLLMDMTRNEKLQHQQLTYIQHLQEAQIALMQELRAAWAVNKQES